MPGLSQPTHQGPQGFRLGLEALDPARSVVQLQPEGSGQLVFLRLRPAGHLCLLLWRARSPREQGSVDSLNPAFPLALPRDRSTASDSEQTTGRWKNPFFHRRPHRFVYKRLFSLNIECMQVEYNSKAFSEGFIEESLLLSLCFNYPVLLFPVSYTSFQKYFIYL